MTYEYSNFRIVKTKKGYRVDIQKSKWTLFGIKKYWTHFISYSGLVDHPFYYSTFNMAMEGMLKEIRWEVLENFYFQLGLTFYMLKRKRKQKNRFKE